ncbi:MAG TPA: hypothetical protein DCS43_13955 [Verrucomicrobia bacterium]|nr:hypothetical protein [Verrucomicrobiota bacterium]
MQSSSIAMRRPLKRIAAGLGGAATFSMLIGLGAMQAGCTSSALHSARQHYYAGESEKAIEALDTGEIRGNDAILALMERGMIRQTAGDYTGSVANWQQAADEIKATDYIRVSEKATSLVINDYTETYRAKPYERTLLHVFTAKSYFAIGQWREAAVEARLVVDGLVNLDGYPDDPYARYVAGLAFELIRDDNGARLEYTQADELTPTLNINPQTGAIAPSNAPLATATNELICLLSIGQASPPYSGDYVRSRYNRWGTQPYADIIHDGTWLGRSYTLNTTDTLSRLTADRLAAIKAVKTVSRIAIKWTIADAVSENNPVLGELLRFLLLVIEVPDERYWATLPEWLQVARVPCPPDMQAFDLVFRNASGGILKRQTVSAPYHETDGKIIVILRTW